MTDLSFRWQWRLALKHPRAPLSMRARLLGHTLAMHFNDKGEGAWPSAPTLAGEMGCDRATVFKALNDLEEAGFLERRRRANTSNVYRATIPHSFELATREAA